MVFKRNQEKVKRFFNRPYDEEFKNTVIDLTSWAFKVKIIVFSVPPYQNTLNETIFCNNFKTGIRILESNKGTFEAIYRKGY